MLAYTIHDKESFHVLNSKVQRIRKHTGKSPSFLIVGNKKDLDNHREVTYEEAQKKIGAEYVDVC